MSTSTAREQSSATIEHGEASARELRREAAPAQIQGRLLANRYLPERVLGAGPFGTRYLADDLARGEAVCVELLPRRALAVWSELRALTTRVAELGEPGLARLLGHGVAVDAWPFWVTEHGRTLRDELAIGGAFELARVARIGARCAQALAAAHAAGVVHAALAPDRILVGSSNPLGGARIAGFGLSPLVRAHGDALFGSPPELYHYVSPEHARGEPLEARSDVYSLGAILYELAVGATPFEGTATAVLRQHRRGEAVLPSRRLGSADLAVRAFDKIVARCLAKRPAERYAGAAELAVDLARLESALARLAPERAEDSGPRVAPRPGPRTLREVSPARHPPKRRAWLPAVPKVIVQGG
jgi:eukaryotic-like serine/threonine-protein kinase